MTYRRLLGLTLSAFVLWTPLSAQADNVTGNGWYVGGGGMAVFQSDAETSHDCCSNTIEYEQPGWGIFGNVGYAWRGGIRTEGEVAYRRSEVDRVTGVWTNPYPQYNGGNFSNLSFMANVLYDLPLNAPIIPYIGAGVGVSSVNADNIRTVVNCTVDDDKAAFAYQFILGAFAPIGRNWGITADYRYFATPDVDLDNLISVPMTTENMSHNIMLGLRYSFGGAPQAVPLQTVAQPMPAPVPMPPAPVPAPQPPAPVVAPVPQSYMVFFDFDRSTITPEAHRIISTAAEDYRSGRYIRVVVTGHTDTMGTVWYNQRLSERRAAAVKSEFARMGINPNEITTVGAGKSSLLVPTNDQVREAQNRRAEIVFNNR